LREERVQGKEDIEGGKGHERSDLGELNRRRRDPMLLLIVPREGGKTAKGGVAHGLPKIQPDVPCSDVLSQSS